MKWKETERYESIHNYIGVLTDGTKILRKGAASACEGEMVIIPINMRDGVILGVGKGNAKWNYSAPHGSGRVLRRDEVKNHYAAAQQYEFEDNKDEPEMDPPLSEEESMQSTADDGQEGGSFFADANDGYPEGFV